MIKYVIAVGIGAWLAHGGLLPDPSIYVMAMFDMMMGFIA